MTNKDKEAPAAISIVPKITVATMGCNPSQAKADDKKVLVARVAGKASGLKHTVGKDGDPTTGVTGEFFGVNAQKGTQFQSGVLYLPSGIIELLIDAVVGEGELDANDKPIFNRIEFAFEIFAVPAKNPIGYSYQAKTLMEAKASEDQERFLALISGGNQKALPKS